MPLDDPKFLSREQVDAWHRFSLEQHGGSDGLRSEDSLESALGAPINDYYFGAAGLFEIAAAYAFILPKLRLIWMATNARLS